MSRYKLINKVDRYILFFNKRSTNDPIALAMTETLKKFKEAKGTVPKMDSSVRTALGYYADFRSEYFDPLVLTQDNCINYLVINKFIHEINKLDSRFAPKMFQLFNDFKKKALTPALYKFKELELQLQPEDKAELESLFKRLKELFEASDDAGPDLEPITRFMESFRKVLEKENPSIPELIELNQNAIEAKKAALNLPEIKEIKEYHWIINRICNFINQYIGSVFSSQATKNIQFFFGALNQKSVEKTVELEQVESELLKEVSKQFHL